jgi:hypothetical protein
MRRDPGVVRFGEVAELRATDEAGVARRIEPARRFAIDHEDDRRALIATAGLAAVRTLTAVRTRAALGAGTTLGTLAATLRALGATAATTLTAPATATAVAIAGSPFSAKGRSPFCCSRGAPFAGASVRSLAAEGADSDDSLEPPLDGAVGAS